ncbi:Alcohol dehydrogenase superfamily, zinc-type [Akanthomyces lecanii RCEF 1005]|uniref:Alcohol dehydrogenase superfamily, zinc-type n=1 Tax=Akanthomyces lecanii RCEF 1005 TaxID=1081108 RepID=A0A168G7D1_CORDF|nr:Alcohol dehydrogenase superfamily, zinc-type [Akanthomyces lecanii RCEF 1005]
MEALTARDHKQPLSIQKVDIPEPGADDVIIKVVAAGLTPGVVKMVNAGRSHLPTTVGHEAAGVVSAVGSNVTNVATGDRVRLHPVLSCRNCQLCLQGQDQMCDSAAIMGFASFSPKKELYEKYHDGTVAEFVRAPSWLVDHLPTDVSFETGAKLHDLATAARAIKLARLPDNATIVLTAPTGAMGALSLRVAEKFGIGKIVLVGRSKERMDMVRQFATVPTEIYHVSNEDSGNQNVVKELVALAPEGIDAIIDYLPSGNLISKLLPAMSSGGVLVHYGGNPNLIQVPLVAVMAKCWTIIGARAHTREDAKECLQWLSSGEVAIDDLITHRFKASEVDKMLQLMDSRDEHMLLTVLNIEFSAPAVV